MPHNQTCDLETYGLELEFTRDLKAKVLVSVSRPSGQGLGLGLETWWPRSWSWSRAFFKGLDNKSANTYDSIIFANTSASVLLQTVCTNDLHKVVLFG